MLECVAIAHIYVLRTVLLASATHKNRERNQDWKKFNQSA